jgi:hypothetical protein
MVSFAAAWKQYCPDVPPWCPPFMRLDRGPSIFSNRISYVRVLPCEESFELQSPLKVHAANLPVIVRYEEYSARLPGQAIQYGCRRHRPVWLYGDSTPPGDGRAVIWNGFVFSYCRHAPGKRLMKRAPVVQYEDWRRSVDRGRSLQAGSAKDVHCTQALSALHSRKTGSGLMAVVKMDVIVSRRKLVKEQGNRPHFIRAIPTFIESRLQKRFLLVEQVEAFTVFVAFRNIPFDHTGIKISFG